MLNRFYFVVIGCGLSLLSFSQTQTDVSLTKIVPPSPEASAFAKYGTYPIGTYTGKPDISVPIYEIKEGGLSVPISLSYDATGIRVNDVSSWVGMNWSLNAGGMVSQMVAGLPDINDNSFGFAAVPPRASEIVNNATYFNFLQGLVDGDMMPQDGDPDKFFYSFNGRGGSFVLDRNRNVMQIPKTSLKISVNGSLINGISIVDENGTKYIFTVQETTETYSYSYAGPSPVPSGYSPGYKNYKTAYYLSEIVSHDGINHINFIYENETSDTKDESYSETYGPKFNQGNQFASGAYHEYRGIGVKRVISSPRLRMITFINGKVEFTGITGRQDDAGIASRLDEITIYSKNPNNAYTKLKSFKFVQSYYYSSLPYPQYSALPSQTSDRYRLRLDELKLKDATGTEMASYKFAYNGTELPPKSSCSQDWWGYYNGKPNTTLVPLTTIASYYGGTTTVGSADRSSVESSMKAGILEKITYPTGGYTLFDTESHKLYAEYDIGSETHAVDAQGFTQAGVPPRNLQVETFVAPLLINGPGLLRITIGPYTSGYPQPFVKIKNMSTGQEQIFTSPDMTQWFSTSASYDFTSGTTYELTASCYVNQSYAMANLNASFSKTIYNPHLDPIGGLRIKSIKNYSADNKLANEENYVYGGNGGGVFVGVSLNTYSYSRSQRVFWAGGLLNCLQDGGVGAYVYGIFLGGPLYDPSLVQGSPVVYTQVVKYHGSVAGNTGKTVYNYGTGTEQAAETRPLPSGHSLANNQGIIIINDMWRKGHLKLQQEFKLNNDGTYSLVQENQNLYNILYTDTTYGLMAQVMFDRVAPVSPDCIYRYFSDYAWADYPIYSGYVQLSESRKKDYSSNGTDAVESVVNYTYDNTHKDIEIKTSTLNSKGETIETEKKYPFQKAQLISAITSSESTTIDDMVAKNILTPIEVINRKNSLQLLLKKTTYDYVNATTIAPVNVKFQKGSDAIETRIQFLKYDALGNLVEQLKVNDVKEVYLWGYNSKYPVAKIINSTYDIAQTYITQSILDNPTDDGSLRANLANLRNIPGAFVTTYTYKPLVGTSSETDPNARTSYYEYDNFSRLKHIKDFEGNIIKNFQYHYLNNN